MPKKKGGDDSESAEFTLPAATPGPIPDTMQQYDEEGSLQITTYNLDTMAKWSILVSGGKFIFLHPKLIQEMITLFIVAGIVSGVQISQGVVFKQLDLFFGLVGILGATLGFVLILFLMTQAKLFGTCVGLIGAMGSQVKQITMTLAMFGVDMKTLQFVHRVARASLVMKFMQQRHRGQAKIENLVNWKILPKEEAVKLYHITCVPEEAIWQWLQVLLRKLINDGVVHTSGAAGGNAKGLCMMIAKGQAAMNAISSEQAAGVPFAMTHLLGLLVQFYNVVYAVLQGFIIGNLYQERQQGKLVMIDLVFAVLTLFAVTLMLSSLLLIAFELMDPFSGDLCDLSMSAAQRGLMGVSKAYQSAMTNIPAYISDGNNGKDFSGILTKAKGAKSKKSMAVK